MNLLRLTTICLILLLNSGAEAAAGRWWVFFEDKGYTGDAELQAALARETARLLPGTRARLAKVRPAGALLGEQDMPVCAAYLAQIEELTGLQPHAVIRSLNAATYRLTADQVRQIGEFDFVRSVRPVKRYTAPVEEPDGGAAPKPVFRSVQDSLFYGGSYTQNALENFPPAHEEGYTGEGVLVGALDAGWNNLDHRCFEQLEIVATWDFVNGDSSVADDAGQMGSGAHGTKTLSCLAAYDPGQMIGTAYGVSVALAKTENTEWERKIEEDDWIAGIAWLDSLGCQVVTSSVSYREFDAPDPDYEWEDLDGNTALITIAADDAVARGIVVLNSDGNNGSPYYPSNKINVPADGDSVLSIGSVRTDSTRASFSSYGPTYDGRIKPDLVAQGSSIRSASTSNDTTYNSGGTGSSYATPITAGACAILLQVNPMLTPMEVHAFLKATGDQATAPDTLRGWGIYNVWEAVQDVLAPVEEPGSTTPPGRFVLFPLYPNPFNGETTLQFYLPVQAEIAVAIYDIEGRNLGQIAQGSFSSGEHRIQWNATTRATGIYFINIETPWGNQVQKALLLK